MADHCVGIVTYGGRDLVLATPHEEGICIIVAPADKARVLRGCQIGHRCTVSGKTELCVDSGECVEVTNVTAARTSANR
jgi:hypothetical protein